MPNLTEAVREGRLDTSADITGEGDPEDDEPMVVEGDVMTFAWEDQIRSRKSSMHLQIPTPHHAVPDQKPTRSPEAEVSTSADTDMEIGVNRRVRFRDKRDSVDIIWTHSSDRESDGGTELRQVSTATASDNPTGERLYLSMTEERPSGDHKMTMQRDRHGRWMPTKGERTMNRSQEHAMSKVCDGLRGDAFVAAPEVGFDNLCEIIDGRPCGIDTLIIHMRGTVFPLTERESKELFRQ